MDKKRQNSLYLAFLCFSSVIAIIAGRSISTEAVGIDISRIGLFVAASILLFAFSILTYLRTKDLFHPLVVYVPIYTLAFLGFVIYISVWGIPPGYEQVFGSFTQQYSSFITMFVLGGVGCVIGYYLANQLANSIEESKKEENEEFLVRLKTISQILMLIASSLLWFVISRVGVRTWLLTYGQNQFNYDSSYFLYQVSQILWFSSFILYWVASLKQGQPPWIRTLLFILLFLLPIVLRGDRSALMIAIIEILVGLHAVGRLRLRFIWIIIVAILFFYVGGFISLTRGQKSIEDVSVKSVNVLNEMSRISSYNGAATLMTMNLVPDVIPFQYGATFYHAIVNLTPSILAGERAIPSLMFHYAFAPESRNHGYGFSILAEAYMNFGVPGGFLIMSCLMFLLTYVYNYYMKKRRVIDICMYAILLPQAIWWIRSDSTPFIKFTVYSYGILLGAYYLAYLPWRRRVSHNRMSERVIKD